MKKNILRFTSFGMILFWMCLIFYFSNQPAGISDMQSAAVREVFASKGIFSEYINFVEKYGITLLGVRKLAHMFLYCMLGIAGFAFFMGLTSSMNKAALFAAVSVLGYSIVDEIHQLFVPGRSGMISDVIIDGIGMVIGIGFGYICTLIYKKRSIRVDVKELL